ncbi:MAG TPA: hypothetical protein VLM05_00020 [Mycobacteriales bacterium]|nr:hypothetical protein [Mycobacteriales bacterium]
MSVRTFPALGFDPAPGSPAALRAQARSADLAARTLAGAAASATRLDAAWSGAAATAYRSEARALPGDLHLAAAAHGTLARELAAFADDLCARQRRAAELESRAAALRATAGLIEVAQARSARPASRVAASMRQRSHIASYREKPGQATYAVSAVDSPASTPLASPKSIAQRGLV